MKDRSFKIVAVVALVMALSGLVVAYAAYSTTLKVSGTVTAKSSKQSWNVQFQNLSAGTKTGLASIKTAPTLSATQVSGFEIEFFAPGDSIEYTWDVTNAGKLDAKLTTASIGSLSCAAAPNSKVTPEEVTALCKDLTMSLTYGDNSEITTNAVLPFASDNTKQLKLKVTWNAASTATISDDVTVTVGESTFVYTQN